MENIENIVHVVDWFRPEDSRRIDTAARTWRMLQYRGGWRTFLFTEGHYPRTSADIGDTRKLPCVRDIFDHGAAIASDAAIIVFTNTDICLTPESRDVIWRAMDGKPCCFSRRADVADASKQLIASDLAGIAPYMGVDLFAVRPRFWRAHAAELPDVFLACEQWDLVYRRWMLEHNPEAEITTPIIYHEKHHAFWHGDETWNNPARAHNRRVCGEWCAARGFSLT